MLLINCGEAEARLNLDASEVASTTASKCLSLFRRRVVGGVSQADNRRHRWHAVGSMVLVPSHSPFVFFLEIESLARGRSNRATMLMQLKLYEHRQFLKFEAVISRIRQIYLIHT